MRDWRRPIDIATATPFRLCFRLEEPPEDQEALEVTARHRRGSASRTAQDSWQVRYLLQAVDDPSLLLPAEQVWTARGRKAALLRRPGFNPQEYLLSSLGHASAISPRIEESLKSPAPGGYELDAVGAHEFLTEKAWLLEQSGFGVLLPAWWTRKGTKLRLSVRAHVPTPRMQGGGLRLDDLLQFNWEVALGDQTLSLQELETLARLKAPLVKVRGQWVQVNAEEIQAALAFWRKKAEGQATVRELVQVALGGAGEVEGIPFEGVQATGWLADFLAQLEGRAAFEEVPVAEGFRGTLRPYQVRGFSWLAFLRRWGLGACLADDMGLGKTVQALALIQREWETQDHRPTLLICPMSVVGNWQKEAARFTPELPVLVHHGLTRTRGPDFQKEAARHALVLSSFSLLHRDFEILKEVRWANVILDEAQNIKNPETKQARAARALPADFHLALTGTPVENHVGDLWSILEFLNPGFLGSQAEFKRRFFIPIQANRDPEAAERLKRLTGPFILRRLKTDKAIIADLPDKMEMKVFCTLTREQASLYAAVVEDASRNLEETTGIQRKGVVLATLSKLKQVCNHPAQFLGDHSAIPGRSGKLARLTEMLEEVLEEGDRALIFSQFAEMGEIIRRHLQETFGREVLFLHGGVPKKQRDQMVARFQEDDGPRLFVLSLKAGGTGLNLTAANHVFHFDRWWNPAVENQATDRAFRIGQKKNVQVHKFLCAGTLEDRIDEMIEHKQEIAGKIVGTGEGWLTELSTAELKDLFTLRAEALGE
ncbi:MAG: DEAD/DEAH box helicase [Planctomycetes bacterium]|nr:DEAD/DEAH box helicase [Planctomycetota bacterium]